MTSPLLHQYQVEDVVQFLPLKRGLGTKLQLVNRHIQLFVRKILSKRTHNFETEFYHNRRKKERGLILICGRVPRMTITELFNQVTDGTIPPPPDYYHYGVVKISVQDLCPELDAILRTFKSAFRGCDLWINYGYHITDGKLPAPFTTQAQLISKLREMFEIFTDVTAIRLFGYNLSNFPDPFAPHDNANSLMSLDEFLKVSSLDIHLRKSLERRLTVPFDASHPQISEEDICVWLHANPNPGQNSRLVTRKMNVEIFYLTSAFIVKIVKMISEIFFASTDLCSFDLSMECSIEYDGPGYTLLEQKDIAAELTQLFSSHSADIFSSSILTELLPFTRNKTLEEVYRFTLKNKTTNETLVVGIRSLKVTIARHV
ncbi:hypothetical protein Ddc_16215 [Ditylenchus destructor]|nr:hypothetical protein Ddc_16215 [Ditylenchus destructor]